MLKGTLMGKPNFAVRYANLRARRPEFISKLLDSVNKELTSFDERLEESGALLRSPLALLDGQREDITQRIKVLQERKNESSAMQRRLRESLYIATPSYEELLCEYKKITQVPSVINVRVFKTELTVLLAARIYFQGSWYDLGDWSMKIDLAIDQMSTRQLRSGLTSDIIKEPHYAPGQYAWNFGFCFGKNLSLLQELVKHGDYVTAVQTAAVYMNDVNEEHRDSIPIYYRKVG